MINFRYHVVSLTAVFLALAIGLVAGTAALNGPVSENLQNKLEELNKDNNVRREQVTQLNEAVNRNQDFATQIAPMLLSGKLAGRKLAVVVLPGNEEPAEAVAKMLTVAGATITARVEVEEKFFDASFVNELLYLADESVQDSIPAAGLPRNSDGIETASALLALTLLQGPTTPTPGDVTAVLAAFAQPGYVTVQEGATGGAEAIVLVAGTPATDKTAERKSAAAVTVATEFRRNQPLIVVGDVAGDGNLVASIRNDPSLAKDISTVDNLSTVQGQVVTALVTADRLVTNRVGQYGTSAGATAIVPSAAP
ncbi:copper transporter [Actinoplanes sp. NEAU-A12]|uniref:Copper transporter n=1 Tax=Actinoplanes sandaracinus TaxID=3045177 RepID=A0ABT6WXJ5_9ACTN|nr:copper transporter [Actinoplanes sandaracinus]MDI6104461.1 copper transporter [Actinoplanes sandaracinus]